MVTFIIFLIQHLQFFSTLSEFIISNFQGSIFVPIYINHTQCVNFDSWSDQWSKPKQQKFRDLFPKPPEFPGWYVCVSHCPTCPAKCSVGRPKKRIATHAQRNDSIEWCYVVSV